MNVGRGTLVLVGLDPARGHEQHATRPCVIVSDPEVTASARYPMVAVVPVTTTPGQGALYPTLEAHPGGLRRQSWALIDQVRSIDKRRVVHAFDNIRERELRTLDEGLRLFLAL